MPNMGPGVVSLLLGLSLCPLLAGADPPDRPDNRPPGPPGPPGPPREPWEHGGWGRPRRKPGECPEDVDFPKCRGANNNAENKPECDSDRECKGEAKCCFSACKYKCLLPQQDKGDFCPYFSARMCMSIRTLPNACHKDSQCQGTDKCCSNNCRQECTPSVKEKPGNCPRPEIFCSHREWHDERGSCTTDRDCPGREKCCAPRCRRECKNVDVERPGKCPEMRDRDDRRCWGPPRHQCDSDDICFKGQKCCTIGCWRQCVYV